MASYVLHIPTERNPVPAILDKYGLQSLAENCSYGLDVGPEGKHGVMLSWYGLDDGPPPGAERTWQQLPGKPDVWMGVEKSRPIRPRDIQQRQLTPGYDLLLADGQPWHLPALRNVTHVHRLNGLGQYERTVAPEFVGLWEQSQEYAGQFFRAVDMIDLAKRNGIPEPPPVDFTCEESFDYCCKCLALNYRLTPEIISLLDLIDDDAMRNIIKASIDLPVLIKFNEKKKNSITIPVG